LDNFDIDLENILPATQSSLFNQDIPQEPSQPRANVFDTITEISEPKTISLSQFDLSSENTIQSLDSNPADSAGLRCNECGKTLASKALLKYKSFTLKMKDLY